MRDLNNKLAITLLALVFSAAAAAETGASDFNRHTGSGDPAAGKIKSRICQGCHGLDGNSSSDLVPSLAGQYDEYIVKQMRNYQNGTRSHELMNGMAAPLSDQDLADIAAYFASQQVMKGSGGKINERGKAIFMKGNLSEMVMSCQYCHGQNGKGLDSTTGMYPVIGGQHKAYLLKQLKEFREDDRVNSPNAVMNKTLKALSDEDLEALADYIATQ